MATINERFDQWLRDAHALEQQAETMMNTQAQRIESYPELQARIQQHSQETRVQRERLETILDRRGISRSAMKDLAGQFTAMMKGAGDVMAGDEVAKGIMSNYAFEHFEIASYRMLVATAEAAGDHETASLLQQSLREEEAMASWLSDNMERLTKEYLRREEASLEGAKR